MARALTTQISLGFKAPDFKLIDTVSDKYLTLSDVSGEHGTVVMFICNHCPFVVHVIDELVRLGNDYMAKGFGVVAICANDVVNYPDDSSKNMKSLAIEKNFPFPYLYDESQEVAKSYDAACTPDFSVFDKDLLCVYRGQLDDARPENIAPVNGNDLRMVLDSLLIGEEISKIQKPSIGCNIKWK
jgi:peroxiredoxin